jgi:hypothetical protein
MSPVADEKKIEEGRIDLENFVLAEDEAVDLDTQTDSFTFPAPPADGQYLVALEIDQTKGIELKKIKKEGANKDRPYLNANLIAKIIDPDGGLDGVPLFDNANTIIGRNRTCRVGGILLALGIELPASTTQKQLMELLRDALAVKPSVYVTTRWEGYSKILTKTVCKGQRAFPPKVDENGEPIDGEFQHTFVQDGEEISAQAKITRYDRVDG